MNGTVCTALDCCSAVCGWIRTPHN